MNSRIAQLQRIMQTGGVDACLLKQSENLVLFTGYWPRIGFSYLFVPAVGEALILAPKGELGGPESGFYTKAATFGMIHRDQGDPIEHLTRLLTDVKRENGIADGCVIGGDFGGDVYAPPMCSGEIRSWSLTDDALVKSVFHPGEIRSLYAEIEALRRCKTPYEIERIDKVWKLAHKAADYFEKLVQETDALSEIALVAEVEKFIATGAHAHGGEYAKAWAQVSAGAKTVQESWYPGLVSSAQRIPAGEFVMLEMGVTIDGYWADVTRTAVAGGASPTQQKLLQMVADAQQCALCVIKDGAIAGDVDAAARSYLQAQGYADYFIHGSGHGVGFVYHEREPFIVPGNPFVLREGMIFSCEPGIYIENIGGIRNEINVLVTKTGHRILGRS